MTRITGLACIYISLVKLFNIKVNHKITFWSTFLKFYSKQRFLIALMLTLQSPEDSSWLSSDTLIKGSHFVVKQCFIGFLRSFLLRGPGRYMYYACAYTHFVMVKYRGK